MKNLLLFLSTIFILGASVPAVAKDLILSLGEAHSMTLKGSPTVWIQDREILKAEGLGTKLLLKAGKEGRTTLKVGADVYQVQVLHPNKTDSLADLNKLLKTIVGLSAQVMDGDLIVTGTLYRLKDWIKIADFARGHHLQYQMRAKMSDSLQNEAQEHFRTFIANVRLAPQTVIFEPAAEVRINSSGLNFKKYQNIYSVYGISTTNDENSLDIAPTVKVEITVAEIKKGFSSKYGVQWPPNYSAQVMPDGSWARQPLEMSLNMLEKSGDGKILASPNILCRSGKEAEFLAGGEFPIKILGYKSQGVIWKRYGILLRVKPKADSAGRISLSVETEITTLDLANSVDGIPGLLTNRVSSHFDLTRPQTIALSGLLKNEEGKSSSGLPLLSRLPILGALFSSKDFQEDQSELVIFVRPTILNENEQNEAPSHLSSVNGKL